MLRRNLLFVAVVWLALISGCARMPTGITSLRPATLKELNGYLLTHRPDLELFRLRGPFEVDIRKNLELHVPGTGHIDADAYLAAPSERAPLVIVLHGLDNTKEDHAYQALHLATWGLHSLVVQLPNKGPWVDNGRILASLVQSLSRRPETVDRRIDPARIILVGHSFGGGAAAVALGEGAPAAGGILLDPASENRAIPGFLARIDKPVMVLAADRQVTATLNRTSFYRNIRKSVAEVAIKDAAHEDGQFPLQSGAQSPAATLEQQITFVSALTASAFSIGATGRLDYAWSSFRDAIGSGKLVEAKKK